LGFDSRVYADVGVAGIQRLMESLDAIRKARVVIVFAGFEGALASVVAGQVSAPVIGVPTSVGYGVAAGGQAALNAMLSSCANGLLVTNIDNGCGAAMAAARILPLPTL
jgi:NCAIR mutase (PurE)-related protein